MQNFALCMGYNYEGALGTSSTVTPLAKPTKSKIKSIRQVACGFEKTLYLTTSHELYITPQMSKIDFGQSIAQNISSGYNHSLICTSDGLVYAIGDKTKFLCNDSTTQSKNNYPIKIAYFEKENLDCVQVLAGYSNSFFLFSNGDLYLSGLSTFFKGGLENLTNKDPIKFFTNVKNIYSGPIACDLFITTNDNKIFSCGRNDHGQLSNETQDPKFIAEEAKLPEEIQVEDIIDISCGYDHTLLLTQNGKLYSCGDHNYNGLKLKTDSTIFTEIPKFSEEFIIDIGVGSRHSLALTSKGIIYGWGITNNGQLGSTGTSIHDIKKLNIRIGVPSSNLAVHCGAHSSIIYYYRRSRTESEFYDLFKSGEFSDGEISSIPIHKTILEHRVGKKFEEIKQILEKQKPSNVKTFLEWIYSGKMKNHQILKTISESLQIKDIEKKQFLEDLKSMYEDNESKDFIIVVPEEDEENQSDEELDDEMKEEGGEIPVHKIVLLARSGLFREMFKNTNEKSKTINHVKDYSKKSIESLEILIKYFYTNKIEVTADDDPQLIFEELEDAADYYQIGSNLNFLSELKKLRFQFKFK
ncbi:claret isoform a [Anaeramoeba flamelloides]|uniref:Claret isoform a n=1 Tax=Anaeramoeba flamelloides TaxID=1746091 RepID=A0AAV7ZU71_9EUKA|nr:claret isoform a [Anaeramoeba flamelloides]